jgi:hypothetical protein
MKRKITVEAHDLGKYHQWAGHLQETRPGLP